MGKGVAVPSRCVYEGTVNWRSVRSEEFVTSRLVVGCNRLDERKKLALVRSKFFLGMTSWVSHRPHFVNSRPFITLAPEILCRAIICTSSKGLKSELRSDARVQFKVYVQFWCAFGRPARFRWKSR